MSYCEFLEGKSTPYFRREWECTAIHKTFDSDRSGDREEVESKCETDRHYDCPYYKARKGY